MEGIERLQEQVLEMNNIHVSAIFEYLKTRNDLYEKFNNDEKSIQQMYTFIYEKARSLKQDNVAMVLDKVVYLWAVTYFNKSNAELGISQTSTSIKKTEAKQYIKNSEKNKSDENNQKDNQISMFQEVEK